MVDVVLLGGELKKGQPPGFSSPEIGISKNF